PARGRDRGGGLSATHRATRFPWVLAGFGRRLSAARAVGIVVRLPRTATGTVRVVGPLSGAGAVARRPGIRFAALLLEGFGPVGLVRGVIHRLVQLFGCDSRFVERVPAAPMR